MKANEVSNSPLAQTLKAQLDEIKLKLDDLSKENNLGADKIREYCDGLRNEVQLSSEELIENINKHNLELIEQINDYETKSMLDFNKESKIQLDSFIQEMNEFHTKWVDYLKQLKLEESDLNGASHQAIECLVQINKENELILVKLFNDNLLTFNKNSNETNSSIVGSLLNSDIQPNKLKHLINLNPHNLPSWCKFNKEYPISLKLLNDGKISAAYRKSDFKEIELVIFDSNLNRLHQKDCITARNFQTFQLTSMANNSIVLCFVFEISH